MLFIGMAGLPWFILGGYRSVGDLCFFYFIFPKTKNFPLKEKYLPKAGRHSAFCCSLLSEIIVFKFLCYTMIHSESIICYSRFRGLYQDICTGLGMEKPGVLPPYPVC